MYTSAPTPVSNEASEDDIDLLRYGRFIASYWMVLAGGAILGTLVSVIVATTFPPRFQATATLALMAPNFPSAVALTPASAKALVAGLTVVSETVKETGLDRDGMTPQTFVADALDVQPVPSTNLVRLSVTLTDPSKAQHAAALLATKLVAATRRIDRETAAAAQETVDEELAGARAGLGKAEQEVLEFETRADVEGLEADVLRLQREHRPTASQRTELYRRRLEVERLHNAYLERARVLMDLANRHDAASAKVGRAQVQVVEEPIKPEQPLPRRRAAIAAFGALIGTIAGVVASLLVNKRRVDRSVA